MPTSDMNVSSQLTNGTTDFKYVDVWKFYEERATKLKDSVFAFSSLLLGFMSALLAYTVKEALDFKYFRIANETFALVAASAGLILAALALVVIIDIGHHIERNFKRAEMARKGCGSLEDIWSAGRIAWHRLPIFCWLLILLVSVFGVAFLLLGCKALRQS